VPGGDAVLGNSIRSNGGVAGLGIDLGANGATPNGAGPNGPDHFQNHPVVLTAAVNGNGNGTVTVSFTFQSLPSSTFRLEFFLNLAADTPQGRFFLGTADLTTDANGNPATVTGGGTVTATTVTLTLTPPPGLTAGVGELLMATAILRSTPGSVGTPGDTSEFSPAVVVVLGP